MGKCHAAAKVRWVRIQHTSLLSESLDSVEIGPADDLGLLVASIFCVSHPDAHTELQRVAKLLVLVAVIQWWTQSLICKLHLQLKLALRQQLALQIMIM